MTSAQTDAGRFGLGNVGAARAPWTVSLVVAWRSSPVASSQLSWSYGWDRQDHWGLSRALIYQSSAATLADLEPVSVRVLELARMSVGYGCRLATRSGQPQKLAVGSASSSARSGAGVAAAGTSSIRCQRVLRSAQYSRQRPPPGGGGA